MNDNNNTTNTTMLEYLLILINVVKNKKKRIRQLEEELALCKAKTKQDTSTTFSDNTRIVELEKTVTRLRNDVADREKYIDELKQADESNPKLRQLAERKEAEKQLRQLAEREEAEKQLRQLAEREEVERKQEQQQQPKQVCIEPVHPYVTNNDETYKMSNPKTINNASDLVDAVISRTFIKPQPGQNFIEFTREQIEGYEAKDSEYEFKSIISGITTLYFIELEETTARFIKLITDLFTSALNEYKTKKGLTDPNDIIFIYKGGNALKAIFLDYVYENPGVASDTIKSYFSKYFGKSDADFQIYVYPGFENEKYEEIFYDVTNLAYLLLNRIRNIFLSNISKWLDFYRYKNTILRDKLENYIGRLNRSSTVTKDEKSDYYGARFLNLKFLNIVAGEDINMDQEKVASNLINTARNMNNFGVYRNKTTRIDFMVTKHPDAKKNTTVILYRVPSLDKVDPATFAKDLNIQSKLFQNYKEGSELYITYNDSIDDYKGSGATRIAVKFNLVRMKVNFSSVFINKNGQYGLINIPAELIDISIPHKYSHDIGFGREQEGKRSDQENRDIWNKFIATNVVDYQYVKEEADNNDNFGYKSYTRAYYMKDIEKILFREVKYPWLEDKYEKRIKRLIFLFMVEIFTDDPTGNLPLITQMKVVLANPGTKDNFRAQLEDLKRNFPKINANKEEVYELNIGYVIDKFIEYTQDSDEDFNLADPNVQKYIGVFLDFFDNFDNIYKKFTGFIKEGKIDAQRLQTVQQLGGDFKAKYLKYKAKYLKSQL